MSTSHAPAARAKLARRLTFALLLPLLVLATGCVDEEREQVLGDAIAREINTQAPLVRDATLNRYVQQLGHRLSRVSERPDVPYRFYIINSGAVNAFALPGGHIYLTRGLIERTETISQLGAVLAHEIGHVAARHGARQLERYLRTGSVVSLLYNLILGREPALLDYQALDLGTRLWYASHSRSDEEEADRLAVEYLVESGIDPAGTVLLLQAIREERAHLPSGAEWFSTHPVTADRIRALRREIETHSESTSRNLMTDVISYPGFLHRIEKTPPPPLAF